MFPPPPPKAVSFSVYSNLSCLNHQLFFFWMEPTGPPFPPQWFLGPPLNSCTPAGTVQWPFPKYRELRGSTANNTFALTLTSVLAHPVRKKKNSTESSNYNTEHPSLSHPLPMKFPRRCWRGETDGGTLLGGPQSRPEPSADSTTCSCLRWDTLSIS